MEPCTASRRGPANYRCGSIPDSESEPCPLEVADRAHMQMACERSLALPNIESVLLCSDTEKENTNAPEIVCHDRHRRGVPRRKGKLKGEVKSEHESPKCRPRRSHKQRPPAKGQRGAKPWQETRQRTGAEASRRPQAQNRTRLGMMPSTAEVIALSPDTRRSCALMAATHILQGTSAYFKDLLTGLLYPGRAPTRGAICGRLFSPIAPATTQAWSAQLAPACLGTRRDSAGVTTPALGAGRPGRRHS